MTLHLDPNEAEPHEIIVGLQRSEAILVSDGLCLLAEYLEVSDPNQLAIATVLDLLNAKLH